MKVLLLNQIPEVNNKYTFSLARGLRNVGVEIVVCGIENDDVTQYSDIKYLNIFGCYSKKSNPISKVISYKRSWDRVLDYCLK